jgi:hypothetical protein
LEKLKQIVSTGLAQTAALWEPIALATDWVHKATTILDNQAQLNAQAVRYSYEQLLQAMEHGKVQVGELAAEIDHFLKVTRSYWSGLFHCYDIEGLPRTNNDLEQMFGAWRHHQRRCTGRKVAPASLVVRGSVQLVAAITTQLRSFNASDLATVSIKAWQAVRADLNQHQRKRVQQRQFRRSPTTYLASLEQKLLQLVLPH